MGGTRQGAPRCGEAEEAAAGGSSGYIHRAMNGEIGQNKHVMYIISFSLLSASQPSCMAALFICKYMHHVYYT
jgi:hypothetical protein